MTCLRRNRTGEASLAQLLFLDQTSLSVGAGSAVKLDRFVYNPKGKPAMPFSRPAAALFGSLVGLRIQAIIPSKRLLQRSECAERSSMLVSAGPMKISTSCKVEYTCTRIARLRTQCGGWFVTFPEGGPENAVGYYAVRFLWLRRSAIYSVMRTNFGGLIRLRIAHDRSRAGVQVRSSECCRRGRTSVGADVRGSTKV